MHLQRVAAVKIAEDEPACHVQWSDQSCPYFHRCWTEAIEHQAVSTVPGLGRNLSAHLRDQGIETISDLLGQYTPESLAQIRIQQGSKRRAVGRKSDRIMLAARALRGGTPILHAPIALPTATSLVMFDLEGTPASGRQSGYIYLWGTSVEGSNPMPYQPVFAAEHENGDEEGWFRFLDHARQIFDRYGETIPFVHWASYERTQLNDYIENHGDRNGIAALVLDNLTDLLPIVKDSVALPIHSYSLKQVEEYVGFHRTQTEFGGDWSISVWDEVLRAQDDIESLQRMNQLALYNSEDLDGMWAVYQWLARFAEDDQAFSRH